MRMWISCDADPAGPDSFLDWRDSGYPPRVFLRKSLEGDEKTRDTVLRVAKEFARV